MRYVLIVVVLCASLNGSAQKHSANFKLPENATSKDYSANTVVLKIKPSTRKMIESSSGRIRNLSQIISLQPLVSEQVTLKATAARGPRINKSGIDITQYYRAFVNPGQDIEDVINKLYATGYFELVEPEYFDKMYLTPNDPSISSQYYLNLINAFDAWDITQGSNDVVIAIIDSGGDLDHPDLASKLFINAGENPSNGTDDDNNGFIDDWRGWDFVGADTLNATNSNFDGDSDPSITKGGDISHGTWVAGCAGAATNNGIGIAGVGFNTKLFFTKHSADNQKTTSLTVYRSYSGVLYAAEVLYANGKKPIINCSWGGPFRSQIAQDVITYITLERGALVIAAAGNNNSSSPHYPASYDHVLSVAGTDQNDVRASFSNYGKTVDISAPGVAIRTTGYNDTYSTISGTSFSAPIVSGAAALVWTHNPSFTSTQVAEQLRVTANEAFYGVNQGFNRQLGKGRLDITRALTLDFPSIRATKPRMVNNQGTALEPGQAGKLSLTFTNYLKSSSSGTQVTISSLSGSVTITKGTITLGIVPEGGSISNNLNPFELTIGSSVPQNTAADILITYQDGSYTDYQFFSFLINPSFVNIDDNQITTSVASKGRLGFDDPSNQANGTGFVFNQSSILFEMGLIMGTSANTIKNNVRGINSAFDQDFFERTKIKQIKPGEKSFSEVFGSFSDGNTEPTSSLKIDYRAMVWRDDPADRFIILEYTIKNLSGTLLNNFHFGIFADWDISGNGANDKASFYDQNGIKLGYVYPAASTELPLAGIQLLNNTNSSFYYAIDNDPSIVGIPFGLYDGYTDAEKFSSISSNRLASASSAVEGNDVSHTVSAGPFTIPAGGQVVVAFALHAAFNLTELISSARHADTLYNLTLQAPKPIVEEINVCFGSPASVTATGVGSFKWYSDFTGGEPVSSDPTIVTSNLFNDTTLYVSNADNNYESVRTAANIRVKANPKISASGFTTFCSGQSIILSALEADEYEWSTLETIRAIDVNTPGDYSVTVRDIALNCESTSEIITVTVNSIPTAAFTSAVSSVSHTPVNFTDESTEAISWFWQFGDGVTSTTQNPTHKYTQGGEYTISLTVTNANGCTHKMSKPLEIITSIEREIGSGLSIFPNPANNQFLSVEINSLTSGEIAIELITLQGQKIHSAEVESENGKLLHQIDVSTIPSGMYLITIQGSSGEKVVRKIVKTN